MQFALTHNEKWPRFSIVCGAVSDLSNAYVAFKRPKPQLCLFIEAEEFRCGDDHCLCISRRGLGCAPHAFKFVATGHVLAKLLFAASSRVRITKITLTALSVESLLELFLTVGIVGSGDFLELYDSPREPQASRSKKRPVPGGDDIDMTDMADMTAKMLAGMAAVPSSCETPQGQMPGGPREVENTRHVADHADGGDLRMGPIVEEDMASYSDDDDDEGICFVDVVIVGVDPGPPAPRTPHVLGSNSEFIDRPPLPPPLSPPAQDLAPQAVPQSPAPPIAVRDDHVFLWLTRSNRQATCEKCKSFIGK